MCGVVLVVEESSSSYRLSDVKPLASMVDCTSDIDIGLSCALSRRGPDACATFNHASHKFCIRLTAAILQLRGEEMVDSPLMVANDCAMAFNGEIYRGLPYQDSTQRDAALLFRALGDAKEESSKIELLSGVRGPWAIVYFDMKNENILIGKDIFGRRSLLLHIPDHHDRRLIVCSTGASKHCSVKFWTEIGCGVHRIDLRAPTLEVIKLDWKHNVATTCGMLGEECRQLPTFLSSLHSKCSLRSFMRLLDRSMEIRVTMNSRKELCAPPHDKMAQVLVLFSGGLDSTTIASLAHRHVPAGEVIDLCSVCFRDGTSPDRLAAKDALTELRSISPGRVWRFIEADVSVEEVLRHFYHIRSLIQPQNSTMAYNIGVALWFASRAKGTATLYNVHGPIEISRNYISDARVVLLGHGADEVLGGYRRHRTAFEQGGMISLAREIKLDIDRLWIRNLGRDDRVVSDSGREGRYLFIDEELVRSVTTSSFRGVFNFSLPPGQGDKLILRKTACHLGLLHTSRRPKCALQFGSKVNRFESELKLRNSADEAACKSD